MAELEPAEKHAISHRGRAAGSWRGRSGRRRAVSARVATERAGITKPVAAGVSIASNAILIAQARRRRDHRLDRDPERGAPLDDRPDRLRDRLRRGPPRGRAGRPRAPLRAEKIESVAASIEGMLILVGAGVIIYEAVHRLVAGGGSARSGSAWR